MTRSLSLVALAVVPACFFVHGGPSDMGVTSPTHRSHIGGMVFASSVINQRAENPSAFVDHCVLGQPCYGRFYLPKSLSDSAGDRYAHTIALRATVDGTPYPDGTFEMIRWWSTYNFTLFRAPNDAEAWEQPKWFLGQVASRLPPGEHTVELAVLAVDQVGHTGKPIATGRIALTVPPNGRSIVASALRREDQILASSGAGSEPQQEQPTETASEPEKKACTPDGHTFDSDHPCCSGKDRNDDGYPKCCSSGPDCY